jgi:hypothetical protein
MNSLIIGCLCVSGLAIPVFGQLPSQPLVADIPFAFHLGNAHLNAGRYRITRAASLGQAVRFESKEVSGGFLNASCPSAVASVGAPLGSSPNATPRIVFNKYGEDRYFVSQIWSDDTGTMLLKSSHEREEITSTLRSSKSPSTVTILARAAH